MTARTATQALAAATAALTSGRDITDVLDRLVRDSADVLGAQAVGLLVLAPGGDLELLAATSHQVAELELYQIQQDTGPCIEAVRGGSPVVSTSQDDMRARWPGISEAMTSAGYHSAHAYPLRWHGQTLGALNTFHASAQPDAADIAQTGQALADIATVLIVQTADLSADQVTERVQQVLQARTSIEQAKGVLAYTRGVDMAAAYDLLRRLAADKDTTITDTAASIIARAQSRNQS
jgi:transcriptional regulator with GAF, ATPase, and Fis domain